ncbi:MAG: adenine phosphoribosyltransferase [Planctomycetaceae bacterium]|nr:adenine phosphoribosyltransferase [Planctomycetaceae bacterium]
MNLSDSIRSVFDFPIPGIHYRDITPLLENPVTYQEAIRRMAEAVKGWGKIDCIAAPEARGFIFAAPVALQLGAGLIPIRKPGKLPYKTVSLSYELEYGKNTIQMHEDAIKPATRVLLIDDLLATGGTMDACRQLVENQGGEVVGALFLIELLDLNGREKLHIPMERVKALIPY